MRVGSFSSWLKMAVGEEGKKNMGQHAKQELKVRASGKGKYWLIGNEDKEVRYRKMKR